MWMNGSHAESHLRDQTSCPVLSQHFHYFVTFFKLSATVWLDLGQQNHTVRLRKGHHRLG